MVNLRGLALGFVLGAIPGIVGLTLTAIFVGSGVENAENAIVFLLFASIGGALGALTTIPLAFIRRRRQQASPNSKRYSMVAGLLVGIVPGVNGLVYTAIFVRCGNLGPGIIGPSCESTRTAYLLFFASLLALGGLFGPLVRGCFAMRRSRVR